MVAWNGTSWSAPDSLSSADLQGVSCVGQSFCVTVDGEGNAWVFNGSGWTRGSGDWGGVSSISCVSAGFCVSTAGGVSQFNGSTWTQPNEYAASSNFVGVSCAGVDFCLAVDTLGQALEYTGSWSSPTATGVGGDTSTTEPTGVACWGVGECVVVDNAGDAVVFESGWKAPHTVDPGQPLNAVSCAGTLCMAVDNSGNVLTATT